MEDQEPEPSLGVRERFPAMYQGLREIAGRMMRDQQARSLAPTELVARWPYYLPWKRPPS